MKNIIFAPTPRERVDELDYDIEVIDTIFEITEVNIYYLYSNIKHDILDFLKEKYKNYSFNFCEINLDNAPDIFPTSKVLITDFSKIAPFYSLHTNNYSIFYIPGLNKNFYSMVPEDFQKFIALKEISFVATSKEMLKEMVERLFEFGYINHYINKFVSESIL